ncbi:MAG: cupin domain-containing protein [Armatimonadetes bacterium]|nr:cupin domain-containing protein [Armatimonadota bacterium]
MEICHLPSRFTFSADKMRKANLFETERFFLDAYCLLPGQEQKAHSHAAEDKVYLVMQGTVAVTVGDETQTLGKGMAVLAPAGASHGVKNESGAAAVVLAWMAPHPSFK